MKHRQNFFLLNTIFTLVSCLWVCNAQAQSSSADSLITRGDSLRMLYRFEESAAAYAEAIEILNDTSFLKTDSLQKIVANERLLLSENGKNMADFTYSPSVIAKHMFSIEDFFLYYPLKDRSWRVSPNQLDSSSDKLAKAIYAPAEDKVIYFSAPDESGIRNIYRTNHKDTIWTQPTLLNEQTTSASDEIYPMLSPDGKTLYFASRGLYGVGGYDLYVSKWDEISGDWSAPVNMGFPYSSPANDFLLINTDDGKHTIFASDRGCPKDSVWIYVLEYDSVPVRNKVSDPEELQKIALLDPTDGFGKKKEENQIKSSIPENLDTRRYMDKMSHVRALKDSIAICENQLAEDREKYSIIENEIEKKKLAEKILRHESLIPGFQNRLAAATKELQAIEMDFLFSGVVIDPDKLIEEAEREIISETPDYTFSKMSLGEPLTLEIEKPEPGFDYSFKVLEQGQFAQDNNIPMGIVYQIQMFSSSRKASVSDLKGLSPVFETRSSSGRYTYRVGLFSTYNDVLAHLNAVKRRGFKSAFIVGFVDGKEMQVNKVRTIENDRKNNARAMYQVLIIPTGGELDSVSMEGIRQQAKGKDIARTEKGLIVGPFDNKADAMTLVEFVKVMGYGDASLDNLNNDR